MTTHIALLRGINVGGHNRIAMAPLRDALTVAGMTHVRTYIQSGNVVLRSRSASTAAQEKKIAAVIEQTFGLNVAVMVCTRAELDALIARNPFAAAQDDAAVTVHVALLSAVPDAAKAAQTCALGTPDDQLHIEGRVAYLLRRGGLADSVFAKVPLDKRLGVAATIRKLSTLLALRRIAAELP